MRKNALLLLVLITVAVGAYSADSFKSLVRESVGKAKPDSVSYQKKYGELLKESKTRKGMFVTHFTNKNKLYFELPDSVFRHSYLLCNRIASTSNTSDYVAGQMVGNPMVVCFTHDSVNVYLHKVQLESEVEEKSSIRASFDHNFANPVLKGFPIVSKNKGNIVIDVSSFFGENERCISPIKPVNPLSKLLGGGNGIKGSFVANASNLQEVKTFQRNIEIKSMLSYSTLPMDEPYTVVVQRSLVQLPDNPMKIRLQDNRVGYFSTDRSVFTTHADRILSYSMIHRWRLEPKPEDKEAYFKGKLVVPAKPIVFYVDSAFPEKWAKAVRAGIEDWNRAFEQAGFKNAVIARDYPRNNPSFDPDDMRFNCIRYATTRTANAMGPSYVDPRTGEILSANVIWYHNILSLLHNWRLTQTGAVDPRVRKPVFDDDVMQESLRYVASHEIGHTLGLMHNMGASYAFPVDSLRSVTFTQKYGTTPSIMDYARNNFVAQPGDFEKGVRLTPPVLGVYDIYAIDWGYRLIEGDKCALEEKKTLNAWIDARKNDPMYSFGAQQVFGLVDPTDQTEDLGNDHIKAGNLSISNLKILMKNLEKWTYEPGENYENVENTYLEVVRQYMRHVRHVIPYIGGIEYKEIKQQLNQVESAKNYCDKQSQHKALVWILDQMRTFNQWLVPADLLTRIEFDRDYTDKFQASIISGLYNPAALYRISEGERVNPVKNYTLDGYINDAYQEIFKSSINNNTLTNDEMNIQTTAVNLYIRNSGLKEQSVRAASTQDDFVEQQTTVALPCNHPECNADGSEHSFLRINFGLPVLRTSQFNTIMTSQLRRVLSLYKNRKITATDSKTRNYYEFQIILIEKVFKNL